MTLSFLTVEQWRESGRRDAREWLASGVERAFLGKAARNVASLIGAPEELIAAYVAGAEEIAASTQPRAEA